MVRYLRTFLGLSAALMYMCVLGVPSASGEAVPPAQAVADNGVFLEHVPPPARPAAICIVDSGVDLNPDTAGEVVYREALDGGDPGDVSPDKHGTLMAMMAAAPINGWGMVGAAPGAVKIVSVRVEEPGEGTFPFSAYERGLTVCEKHAYQFNIRAVSLSLVGSAPPQGDDAAMLSNAVRSDLNYGLVVLAAAGNDGGSVESPASSGGVIAVGATGPDGALCAFSNRGPQLAIFAPGCSLSSADSATGEPVSAVRGTSEATSIASALVAELCGFRADVSADDAARALEHAGQPLNVSSAFTAGGLTALVTEGSIPSSATAQPPRSPARPVVRVRVGINGVSVRVRGVVKPLRVRIQVIHTRPTEFGEAKTVLAQHTSSLSSLRFGVPPDANWISVVFIRDGYVASRPTLVSLTRRR